MPVKIARSTPQPSFGLPELLVASHISRLASRDAAKSLPSTLVSESSGECRIRCLHDIPPSGDAIGGFCSGTGSGPIASPDLGSETRDLLLDLRTRAAVPCI